MRHCSRPPPCVGWTWCANSSGYSKHPLGQDNMILPVEGTVKRKSHWFWNARLQVHHSEQGSPCPDRRTLVLQHSMFACATSSVCVSKDSILDTVELGRAYAPVAIPVEFLSGPVAASAAIGWQLRVVRACAFGQPTCDAPQYVLV